MTEISKDLLDKQILILTRSKVGGGVVKQILSDYGFTKIATVSSPIKAMDFLHSNSVDIISSELHLGDTNAFTLFDRMRDNHAFDRVAFVMFATNASKGLVAQAVEEDIDAVISKPFTAQTITETFTRVISAKFEPSEYKKKIEEAVKENKNKAYEKAEKLFKEAIKLDKKPALAYYYLGEIAIIKDNIQQAESYFREGLTYKPNNLKCSFGLVFCLEKREEYAESYVVTKKLIGLYPTSQRRLEFAIEYANEIKNYDEQYFFIGVASTVEFMQDSFKRLLVKASVGLAQILFENDQKRAMTLIATARKYSFHDYAVRRRLAKIFLDNNKLDLADKELAFCKRNGDKSDDLLILEAKMSYATKQYYPCIKTLQALQAKNFPGVDIYILMSRAYLAMNDFDRASKAVSYVVKEMPDNYEARVLLDEIADAKTKLESVSNEEETQR